MNSQLEKISNSLSKKYDLLPWHIEFLNVLMLPKAFRPSRNEILGRFGISEGTYYYWLRHPKLNSARREFVKQYYKDDIPDVLMAMKDEAIAGNPVAAKLFLEYVDDFNKDERTKDPNEVNPVLQKGEVRIIIQQLTNKFYGSEKPTVHLVADEAQHELRGSVVLDEVVEESVPIEVDGVIRDQDI